MLVPYTRNGGMVGATLDFADQTYYRIPGTVPVGEALITTTGTTSWIVPTGVTTISVVCVGAGGGGGGSDDPDETGGGGGGGALAYVNNIPVTPGETLTAIVGLRGNGGGAQGSGQAGGPTSLQRSGTNLVSAGGGGGGVHRGAGGAGGAVIVGNGGSGGNGGAGSNRASNNAGGGGGAGGYAGNGGNGGSAAATGSATAGAGGGGGGGGGGTNNATRGGGGVGVQGQGANGAAGAANVSGGGGSGGATGTNVGGLYGAGGRGAAGAEVSGSIGANGAIRIIWGGDRAFPDTNTADGLGSSTGLVNGNKKNSGIWDLPAVYDSIVSQPAYALGLTSSLLTISGQLNAWTEQTVDISAYAGATVRLAFRYINTGGTFTSDIQLDLINLDGNTYSFENQTHAFETSDGTNYNGIDYTSVNFQNVGVSSNLNGVWQVDSGGTPSGSTGRTDAQDGTFYIYFESSGGAATANFTAWLRSPQVTLGATPTLTFYEARLGASIGQLDVYLEVIS